MFYRIALVITVCLIFSLGIIMIFNTTSAEVLDLALNRNTHQAFFRQIFYAIFGFFCGVGLWKWGYQNVIWYSPAILIFFTILLAFCFVPGIGKSVNGARRWIGIFGMTIQPSEFIKYVVPAFFIYCHSSGLFSFAKFMKTVAILFVPILLILVEPNHGTTGVISLTLATLFFLAKVPVKYWALPLLFFFVIGSAVAYHLPYVKSRLHVYMHPEADLKGRGHQPYQAKIAAGSGRLLGKGIGNSLQKLSYLPEAQNDYIAAIYAEETGFFGSCLLILAYLILAYLGFVIAFRAPTVEASYFAAIITFLFSFQAFMNLGVVSGFLPSTGLNLPFFSQGGSSLIANMMGLGILLSINDGIPEYAK